MPPNLKPRAARMLRKRFNSIVVPEGEMFSRTDADKILGKGEGFVKQKIAKGVVERINLGQYGKKTKLGEKYSFLTREQLLKLANREKGNLTVPEALPIFEAGLGRNYKTNVPNLRHLVHGENYFSQVGGQKKISVKNLIYLIEKARKAHEAVSAHALAAKLGIPYTTLYFQIRKFPEIGNKKFTFNGETYLPASEAGKIIGLHRKDRKALSTSEAQKMMSEKGVYRDITVIADYFHAGKLLGYKSPITGEFRFYPRSVKKYAERMLARKAAFAEFEKQVLGSGEKLLAEISAKKPEELTAKEISVLIILSRKSGNAFNALKKACTIQMENAIFNPAFKRFYIKEKRNIAASGLYDVSMRLKYLPNSRGQILRYISVTVLGHLFNNYFPKYLRKSKSIDLLDRKELLDTSIKPEEFELE